MNTWLGQDNGFELLDDLTLALVGRLAGFPVAMSLSSCCSSLRKRLGYQSRAWLAMKIPPWLSAFKSRNLTVSGAESLYLRFRFLRDQIRSEKNLAFRSACKYGNLPVAQWLASTFGLIGTDVTDDENGSLRYACYAGRLDIVTWLIETFDLSRDDLFARHGVALFIACTRKDMKLIFWLADHFQLTARDLRPPHMITPRFAGARGQQKLEAHREGVQKVIARVAEVYGTGRP